ncbi:MAG TPA: type II toxin-antitoxin system VapC family toxin [Verrucomicrobiota bacterium]|nr:type II toxin-antitoxin system VapC family toxin [Verrucomicrobiota bacterium]
MAGQLVATKKWWRLRRNSFEMFASQLVLDEVAQGDPNAARRRQTILAKIPILPVPPETERLLEAIGETGLIPINASADAVHIAVATANRMHFLLTWNCRHINNGEILPEIERACAKLGYTCPVVCTPLELMGTSES